MSWWAHLECKCCGAAGDFMEREWNYTHNCNRMANIALAEAGITVPPHPNHPELKMSWWDFLDGMEGPAGAAILDTIIKGLEADPVRFDAMNPENGWGSRENFVAVLTKMRDSVPEYPTVWRCNG